MTTPMFRKESIDKCIQNYKDSLDGFEKVLCRKFTCEKDCNDRDCEWKDRIFMKRYNICLNFKISDDTKAEIKLKDREIEKNKIDTHPIFIIQDKYKNATWLRSWELIL